MKIVRYLIVNHKGNCRIVSTPPQRRSQLGPLVNAFKITINLPDVKPIMGEIEITVPAWPPPEMEAEMYEEDPDADK